jgi:hypothetical protein
MRRPGIESFGLAAILGAAGLVSAAFADAGVLDAGFAASAAFTGAAPWEPRPIHDTAVPGAAAEG